MSYRKLRRKTALLLAISMFFSIIVFPGDRSEAARTVEKKGGNLFANGSFEDKDESGNAENWTTIRYSGSVRVSVSDSVYKDGSHAYQLTGMNVTDTASIRQIVQMENETAGKTFKLQFWVKSDNLLDNGKAYVRYQFLNSEGQKIGAVNYSDMTYETTDWTFMEKAFNIPDGTAAINFEAFLDTTTGTVWFDNLRLYEAFPDAAPGGNLLKNGGFEKHKASNDWVNGVGPADTTIWKANGTPVFAVDREVVHSGSAAVRIEGTPPNESRGAVVQQIDTMKTGTPYLISGWYKTKDVSNTVLIRFQYKRNDGNGPVSVNIPLVNGVSGTNEWTYFSKPVTLPAKTDQPAAPVVKMEAFLENSTGTVWFDDFSIAEHVPLMDFSLNPSILEIGIGEETKAEAAFNPENATNRELVWSSSNTVVASVYRDGRVYGHAPGYSVITAMSPETKQTRSAVVSVGMNPPVSLSVQPYSGTVAENGVLTGTLPASDVANAPIAFGKATDPKHGKVTIEPEGTFKYYPDRNFSGTDEFVFMARTAEEGPAFAVASIRVEPLVKPPLLDMLWYWTDKDEPLTGILGNVAAPAGEAVTWSGSGAETRGDLTVQPDGSFTYIPAPGFVGFDTLEVTATASGGLTSTGKAKVFVVPEQADFIKQLADNGFSAQHPRLLATAEDFEYTRSLIGKDRYISEWFDKMKRETDPLLEQEPYMYLENGGNNGNIRDLLIRASLLYRLTGEEKYAQRAIKELESAAKFPDWGGRHNNMLSLTYVTLGSAIAYDWLYEAMSPEQRKMVEDAMTTHAFSHALAWYRGEFTHNGEYNNINLVDNGSFGTAALAFLNEGEEISAQATEVLQGVYRKLQQSLRFFTADGSWPEGAPYWQFGTEPLFHMMAAMEKSLGTDYGLSELEGIAQTGNYPLYLYGPGGMFNFHDAGNPLAYPQSLWMAGRYGKPEFTWFVGDIYRRYGAYSPYYLVYYRPGMLDTQPAELDRTFTQIEAITARSGWDDPNGAYAAMHGFNETLHSHIDLDSGSFVFDALGERWAIDLGLENYNLPGYWDYGEGQRWTYYRKGAQGQNVMVINPSSNPILMQDYDAPALLADSESKPRGAYGILDLTERYPLDAVSYKRGMMLTGPQRDQLILQDELELKSPSELYWFMHTNASITTSDDGQSAILTQHDKKLYVKLLNAPTEATFLAMNAEPLPGTPNPPGQTINHGIRKLAVHMKDAEQSHLSIWMVPLREEDPLPQSAPAFTPLSDWSIPDGELPDKPELPTLSSINVNGVSLPGFTPSKTYYEYVIPFNETAVPQVEATSEFEMTISDTPTLPGKTLIYVTDPANPKSKNRYTVSFVRGPIVGNPPEINRLAAASVTASASPQADMGYTPDKTLDGDPDTRWTSEGHQWIQYDLGEPREVGAVSIAFFSGDTRQAFFDIATSLDGENWKVVFPDGVSSGYTAEPEVFHFTGTPARYVRINGFGNSASRWNNYTEVGLFRPVPVSLSTDLPVVWKPGEQHPAKAWCNFADGRKVAAADVIFASSDSTVLEIKADGRIQGKKPGTVQLTVTDREYGFTRKYTLEVKTPNHISGAIPKK